MKVMGVAFLLLILSSAIALPKIKVIQGSILYVYTEGKYEEVFRAESFFYGYGLLDENRLFVAYQEKSAEAVAIVKQINLTTKAVTDILEVGGAGESHFDSNSKSSRIVFNDFEGIKIIDCSLATEPRIQLIKENVTGLTGFGVFWLNDSTIGYRESGGFQTIQLH